MKCEAIDGIIAEAREHMSAIEGPEVADAGMIGSAQAVEHYEITRYYPHRLGQAAGQGGCHRAAGREPPEEKHADQLLTEIAEAAVIEKAAA
jgi:ferritin-like metal-binding protein YciE